MLLNAATATGTITASEPPATITSTWPRLIASAPSPSECELEAQAETCVRLGPRKPQRSETKPDAAFAMYDVTKNGDTRLGPRSCRVTAVSTTDARPPAAVALETPTRSR